MHAVTGRDLSRFEEEWQEETRRNFRGALWFAAGGGWLIAALVVILSWGVRRRRERPRREALNVGWELPPEERSGVGEGTGTAEGEERAGTPIDPKGPGM